MRSARTFRSLDLVFTLDATDPALRALMFELFEPLRSEDGAAIDVTVDRAGDDLHVVGVDNETVCTTHLPALALAHVLWEINSRAIERTAGSLLLHASAVARSGRVVLFPGRSGSGKSTLAAAFVASGYEYLTDDAVRIDVDRGRACTYPKPIGLGHDVVELLPALAALPVQYRPYLGDEWFVSAAMLGGAPGPDGPPRLVVFPTYGPDAANRATPVSRAEALVLLCENSFNFTQLGPGVLDGLARMLQRCACYRFEFSDANRVIDFVGGMLADAPDPIEIA
jgi:hypothetical protein